LPLSFNSIAFTGNRLERLSELRRDDCVEVARVAESYRLILFVNGSPVLFENKLFFNHEEVKNLSPLWQEAVLLGHDGKVAVLAAENGSDLPAPFTTADMRSLYSSGEIERSHLGILAQASSLLTWHKNNQFCARCGAKTHMRGGGVRRFCDSCQAEHFPRTDPVSIMLVHDQQRCLLARNVNFPPKRFSCLAGFIEQGETFEAAVRRETWEEAGIKTGKVRYIASQPWPFPYSLMLGAFVEAIDNALHFDEQEIAEGYWFERGDLAAMMTDCHPQGFTLPPSGSISHFLIRAFLEEGEAAFAKN